MKMVYIKSDDPPELDTFLEKNAQIITEISAMWSERFPTNKDPYIEEEAGQSSSSRTSG